MAEARNATPENSPCGWVTRVPPSPVDRPKINEKRAIPATALSGAMPGFQSRVSPSPGFTTGHTLGCSAITGAAANGAACCEPAAATSQARPHTVRKHSRDNRFIFRTFEVSNTCNNKITTSTAYWPKPIVYQTPPL